MAYVNLCAKFTCNYSVLVCLLFDAPYRSSAQVHVPCMLSDCDWDRTVIYMLPPILVTVYIQARAQSGNSNMSTHIELQGVSRSALQLI